MNRSMSDSCSAFAVVCGIAGMLFGVIVGYVLGTRGLLAGPGAAVAVAANSAPVATAPTALIDENELQAYRNIVAADPKNAKAAIQLANRLYDAGRYAEAVPSYQQAFALEPRNVNVSTDLGTALWYAGRPDDALAQFRRSLAIDPKHPQTLFNTGIVSLEGKQDPVGAVAAWEKLLETNPSYPEAERVRGLIGEAKAKSTLVRAADSSR